MDIPSMPGTKLWVFRDLEGASLPQAKARVLKMMYTGLNEQARSGKREQPELVETEQLSKLG
jgi:hypothetical protein